MIIKYSGQQLIDHEAMVTYFGGQVVFNGRGRPQLFRRQMVIEGEIVAASASAINSRVRTIENIFGLNGGICALLQSDGTETDFVIGDGALGGCRVVQPPSFSLQDGKAHFTTGLPFSIVLEADYTISDGDTLVSYEETITKIGQGGPRRVTIELDNGPPVEQVVSQYTPIVVVQSGQAVGWGGYPTINDPIYPTQVDLPDGYQLTRGSARLNGATYTEYPVQWSYRMTLLNDQSIPNPTFR